MPAGIGRARAAITVAIKTGHRIIAAKLQFTAELDVRPSIEVPEVEGLEVSVDDVAVTEDDVQEQVQSLRERFGTLVDIDATTIAEIQAGRFPFKEEGGEQALPRALKTGNLRAVSGPASVIGESDIVVLVIGTPVDEYLNPRLADLFAVIDSYLPHFRDGQVLLLRSTVYPGTSERLQSYFASKGRNVAVAFCPEPKPWFDGARTAAPVWNDPAPAGRS